MIYDYDTLDYHRLERPGTMARNLSEVPLAQAGKYAKLNVDAMAQQSPETEALSFYMLNHAMGELHTRLTGDEPLGAALPVVEAYHDVLGKAGQRMFHYLLITTTRESRHITNSQEDNLISKHGAACAAFTKKVKAHAEAALYNYSGDLKLGPYLDYLCDMFNTCSWSSSYGGTAWGEVAQALRDAVWGETNIEMMLDTGYTLAHNNGPIFNKGFQFKHYDAKSLYTILDCQRAGQIPELIATGNKFCPQVNPEHKGYLEMMRNLIGVKINEWVNWALVEKLGAVQNYDVQKKKNIQIYGGNPEFQAENAALAQQVKDVQEAAAAKKAFEEKMFLEIMPGVKILKGEVSR
jgi:hypothetical protein